MCGLRTLACAAAGRAAGNSARVARGAETRRRAPLPIDSAAAAPPQPSAVASVRRCRCSCSCFCLCRCTRARVRHCRASAIRVTMDGLAGSLKLGVSSRRLELPKMTAAPDSAAPPDPSIGLTRAWTQAERLARWPTLDYSQPRDLEPEMDGIYAPHNALRSDMAKLLKALEALAALSDAPSDMEVENLATWYGSFAHLVHSESPPRVGVGRPRRV